MTEVKIVFYVSDVMETVAHMTDGPEPPEPVAEAWMVEHYGNLSDAIEYAAKEYIREHWSKE